MLFLTNFQLVMVHLWKNGHPRKLMTLMKTIFWSLSRQTVFYQNLLNHIRLLFCGISDTSNNLFSKEFYLFMFAQFLMDISQQKVRFAQVLAFLKVAKIEGEVFVALRASQGDLEPPGATISPQSPCSLTPGYLLTCLHIILKQTEKIGHLIFNYHIYRKHWEILSLPYFF